MCNAHKLIAAITVASALTFGSASAQQYSSTGAREALRAAMLNEAFSMAQYKLFAEHASRMGNKHLAEVMTVASNMEYGHFLRWAELYHLVGTDAQNLRAAVADEINDDVKFYERLASEADARGEKALAEHFRQVKGQEEKQQDEFKTVVEKALNTN